MIFWKKKPLLMEFHCSSDMFGVLPDPIPAVKGLPDWYKKIPAFDAEHTTVKDTGITVKRCLPFLDALSAGYLLCAPCDINIRLYDGGQSAETNSGFPYEVIGSHKGFQNKGSPDENRINLKFYTFWTVKTPPGYSALFTHPLNHPQNIFKSLSAVVDTDRYVSLVNMPFYMTGPDGLYTIEKGTPIAQVIPFKREKFEMVVRESTLDESKEGFKQTQNLLSTLGWYRNFIRAKR